MMYSEVSLHRRKRFSSGVSISNNIMYRGKYGTFIWSKVKNDGRVAKRSLNFCALSMWLIRWAHHRLRETICLSEKRQKVRDWDDWASQMLTQRSLNIFRRLVPTYVFFIGRPLFHNFENYLKRESKKHCERSYMRPSIVSVNGKTEEHEKHENEMTSLQPNPLLSSLSLISVIRIWAWRDASNNQWGTSFPSRDHHGNT